MIHEFWKGLEKHFPPPPRFNDNKGDKTGKITVNADYFHDTLLRVTQDLANEQRNRHMVPTSSFCEDYRRHRENDAVFYPASASRMSKGWRLSQIHELWVG